jgi:hypothetical protein
MSKSRLMSVPVTCGPYTPSIHWGASQPHQLPTRCTRSKSANKIITWFLFFVAARVHQHSVCVRREMLLRLLPLACLIELRDSVSIGGHGKWVDISRREGTPWPIKCVRTYEYKEADTEEVSRPSDETSTSWPTRAFNSIYSIGAVGCGQGVHSTAKTKLN